MGSYGIILSLLGCLEHGLEAKKLADTVIDSCMYLRFASGNALTYRANTRRPGHEPARRHIHASDTIFVDV